MVLEQQLNLGQNTIDGHPTNGVDIRPLSIDGGDDGSKAPRLPRWTRQEILVLIQGKKVAENRVRRGRTVGMAFGSVQVEPKWASVSSYCKRHGVNRGPVQCRKRWSNLAGDYKKIKEWESHIRDETESFWAMRNDLRREKKLPGFFDREVYDILDGVGDVSAVVPGLALALAPSREPAEDVEAVFDSGRSAAAEDGLFSDFEQEEAGGSPEKEPTAAVSAAKEVPPIKAAAAAAGIAAPIPLSGNWSRRLSEYQFIVLGLLGLFFVLFFALKEAEFIRGLCNNCGWSQFLIGFIIQFVFPLSLTMDFRYIFLSEMNDFIKLVVGL
ncbi:hypothetical protein MANES_09G187700v8 [Manihot esculenta]|uniref:Uncharacterized protein n=1 Tax=Manihot esculenta TaxID=3983 RepID=A0ACB7H7I5_MANES|nr:hypothetical protein MANES_09G187700v8 [Manihot esculenta]